MTFLDQVKVTGHSTVLGCGAGIQSKANRTRSTARRRHARCVAASSIGTVALVLSTFSCNRSDPETGRAAGGRPRTEAIPAPPIPRVTSTTVRIPEADLSLAPSFGRDESDGKVWLTWLASRGTDGVTVWAAALADPLRPVKVVEGTHLVGNPEEVPRILPHGEALFSAYLVEPYEIRLARSDDRGGTWTAPIVPHRGTAEGFTLPALFPAPAGVGLAWVQEGSIRIGGLDGSGAPSPPAVLDPRTCECCKVDVAETSAGLVVAYRDRSEGEVRDISVVRREDGAWSSPTTVGDGWSIAGCPVNGPAVSAQGYNVVLVFFSGKEPPGRVEAALSRDGGKTFNGGVRLDAGEPLGRVDVVWAERDAIASWVERDGDLPGGARLLARRVRTDGTLGPTIQLTNLAASHDSGFPELAVMSDNLWWTWTGASDDGGKPRARLAHIPLRDLP